MKYAIDITLTVSADNPEDAFTIANEFCVASLNSDACPEGVQVDFVSEPANEGS